MNSLNTISSSRVTKTALFAILLCSASLFFACGPQGSGAGTANSGNAAPDFTLRDLSGRHVRLSDHAGKAILINFWATWCVPCGAEMPHLQRLYETYGPKGFVVLAISMDGPESAANVVSHARRHRLTFPVLRDEETRVVGLYNPKRTAPFSVFIGRDGAIAKVREGFHSGEEIEIEEDIKSLLGLDIESP